MQNNEKNICPPPSVVENNPYISVCGRNKHKFQFSKDELQKKKRALILKQQKIPGKDLSPVLCSGVGVSACIS